MGDVIVLTPNSAVLVVVVVIIVLVQRLRIKIQGRIEL